MSSSNEKPVPGKISNPYARKRPPPSSNQADRHGETAVPSASAVQGFTFSQAFQSIDDTSHFKEQIQKIEKDPNMERLREEQRKLDSEESKAIQQEALANMSDKDHHALLQPHMLYVSTKQKGNGVLNFLRNVPFAYSKMVPDYIMSSTSCALFLSIKYHQLYPHYIHRRLAELKSDFKMRVLLVLVDVEDNANALLYLNKLCVTNSMTLMLAWSEQEAARYLETYKVFNGKDASSIQRKEASNYVDQVSEFLTAAKPVNKTDSANLLTHFSDLRAIMAASKDELSLCPGLGQIKVNKLHDAFHKPFSTRAAANLKRQRLETENKEINENEAGSDSDDDEETGDE